MRRNVARAGRLLLAAALAYLTVGIVWETAFGLALTPSATSDIGPPWEGLISFLAWFVLPSVLWPSSMSAFIPGGWIIATGLFVGMTALMFAALTRLAPDVVAPRGPRRPPKRRSPPRARVGTRRTS
ncbi:MAG TPA: hypothetical protein VNB51_06365, partial [Candidatus Udaeobacter sp.]|nr:hypothetical protein [Candidatus Udaeobacter sp.]